MKLYLLTIVVLLIPSGYSQPHVIKKRFLWKTLAKIAEPFIRRPKPLPPPQAYPPPQYHIPPPPPPVFHVAPSIPQPIQIHPYSYPGQNQQNQQNYPNYQNYQPPAYVPQQPPQPPQPPLQPQPPLPPPPVYLPQSYNPPLPQPTPQLPQGNTEWKPIMPEPDNKPPEPPLSQTNPQVTLPDFGLSSIIEWLVYLAQSDATPPNGFTKVNLPASVLQSMSGLGVDKPRIYLAKSGIASSDDFALLQVSSSTLEALRAVAQLPDSSRTAEMSQAVIEDLVTAIQIAATSLKASQTTTPSLFDFTETETEAITESIKDVETDPLPVESVPDEINSGDSSSTELPAMFLARDDADVPSDYIRVKFPDDVMKQLRRHVSPKTLNAQKVRRRELTKAYLAPSTSSAVAPPIGLVPVHLSREALEVLNNYINQVGNVESPQDTGPQLELPRSVLEQLSHDSSKKVNLKSGRPGTVVKTGSTDVFIADSNQKPPDGYVSIPLTEEAKRELTENLLGTSIGSQDMKSGIPVRAYIASADKKLPPGHVAVPLPDSILNIARLSDRSYTETSPFIGNQIPLKENAVFIAESPAPVKPAVQALPAVPAVPALPVEPEEPAEVVYLGPSRKQAPTSFRKLKLPETVMDSFRQAIPAAKLAESGTPAKMLTAVYLGPSDEFVPPGFLSITVPQTLIDKLEIFSELKDVVDDEESENPEKSSGKANGNSRDASVQKTELSQKMIDAVIAAIKGTLREIVKKPKPENRKANGGKERKGNSNRKAEKKKDKEENDFDDDEDDDDYQPQPLFQASPFFPGTVASYPYVNPYQYSGLWTYGNDGYMVQEAPAQDRNAYYYTDGSQGNVVQYEISQPQYEISQPQYQVSDFQKRQGATQ